LSAPIEIAPTKHPTNADAWIQLTELGMQINCNEQDLKHAPSIHLNLDSDSNVIDPIRLGRFGPPAKHDL
jgi:hypothetical protein